MKLKFLMACVAMALFVGTAHAAFIVEPHPSGKANANFTYQDGTAVSASIPGGAVGLTATNSVYGGNGTIDEYIFSYTPGVDTDNTGLAGGTLLGRQRVDAPNTIVDETLRSTGIAARETGLYNVFITWPASTNVNAAGSKITITSDGPDIVLDPIVGNTGLTGDPGGNNAWLKIASFVPLTAGNTYTVTQLANVASFVSQRSAGVMWEPVPEPSSVLLLCFGGVLALWTIRRR